MPNRDGTGPNGGGPKSGRGLGPCSGDPLNTEVKDNNRPGGGRNGRGPGGRRRGRSGGTQSNDCDR